MKKSPIGEITINNENYYYDRTQKENINKQEDILNTNILSPINGPIPLKDIATISENKRKQKFSIKTEKKQSKLQPKLQMKI